MIGDFLTGSFAVAQNVNARNVLHCMSLEPSGSVYVQSLCDALDVVRWWWSFFRLVEYCVGVGRVCLPHDHVHHSCRDVINIECLIPCESNCESTSGIGRFRECDRGTCACRIDTNDQTRSQDRTQYVMTERDSGGGR